MVYQPHNFNYFSDRNTPWKYSLPQKPDYKQLYPKRNRRLNYPNSL